MKTDIEIVTGFLGAGKTTFINSLLETTLVTKEQVVVLLCEKGEKNIKDSILKDERIKVMEHDPLKSVSAKYISNLLKLCTPHRLIIEYNGTRPLEELFDELNKNNLKDISTVTSIFHIADGLTFNLFFDNMSGIIRPYIQSSHLVIINNADELDSHSIDTIKNRIKTINPNIYIMTAKCRDDLTSKLKAENILDGSVAKKFKIFIKNMIKR